VFVEDAGLVGGHTIRVMLGRLSAADRQAMLASLDFKVD
jgi:hypothetical protein